MNININIALLLVAIVIAVIIVSVIVWYFGGFGPKIHSLFMSYQGDPPIELYKGLATPIYSSDGTLYVVYGASDGTYKYSIDTSDKTKLTAVVPVGLAYDHKAGHFMLLASDKRLYSISQSNHVISIDHGFDTLYDIAGDEPGYYLANGEASTVVGGDGTTNKNNGNYGLIELTTK